MSDKSNKNDADFQNLQDFKKELNYLAFIDGKRCSFEYTHRRRIPSPSLRGFQKLDIGLWENYQLMEWECYPRIIFKDLQE